jgi:hypothetical protein
VSYFGRERSLIVPRSITIIGRNAFSGNRTLRSVQFELSSMIEAIEEDAFAGCSVLSISVPVSLKRIGDDPVLLDCSVDVEEEYEDMETERAWVEWFDLRKVGCTKGITIGQKEN